MEVGDKIKEAKELLEANGYIVYKGYSYLVDKWVAFRQEGMIPVLHDDQRMAYQIGVDNALSALKHLLQEGLRKNNITIYYPNTDTSTELDAESVVKWAESLPDLI